MARCKECLHHEVCMYVNAKAVEYVKAENCKLFKPTADVVPRAMIEEIFLRIREEFSISELGKSALNRLEAELKKKYTEGRKMTDRKLTEAETITYLQMSVELGNTARLAPEEAQRLLDLIDGKTATNEAICEIMEEQRAEIERLNGENKAFGEIIKKQDDEISELRKELLKKQNLEEIFSKERKQFDKKMLKQVKQASAEAVKEVAKKIKADAEWICDDGYIENALIEYVDSLVKERTEERAE